MVCEGAREARSASCPCFPPTLTSARRCRPAESGTAGHARGRLHVRTPAMRCAAWRGEKAEAEGREDWRERKGESARGPRAAAPPGSWARRAPAPCLRGLWLWAEDICSTDRYAWRRDRFQRMSLQDAVHCKLSGELERRTPHPGQPMPFALRPCLRCHCDSHEECSPHI